MFEKVWGMSTDSRTAITVWKVGDRRFIKPHDSEKPPKEVKIIGKRERLVYKGTDLNCDIYEGNVECELSQDINIPQDVMDYTNYSNRSMIILAQIKEKINEIIQESRKLPETSEVEEEPSGDSGSSEDRSE